MSLLVIRTSSMGDVIMTLPVLRAFKAAYPDEELIFVTKKPFDRFITGVPGIGLFLSDHHGRHKGFIGLIRVWLDIRREYKITAVADLHDVIRSKIVRLLFRLGGCRVAKIDKQRPQRRILVKGNPSAPLRHTVERYADVFAEAGYPVRLGPGPWLFPTAKGTELIMPLAERSRRPMIGIAPMAKHRLKMWPHENMLELIGLLKQSLDCTVFLFGSPAEAPEIDTLAAQAEGVVPLAGRISLEEEIALIARLDLMVAMDSSNMHLAAMLGTPTVSIWGATHPAAGFSGWGQPASNQVQIPSSELTCRPCTIYGKGECRRGDLACLMWITPQTVLEKIMSGLNMQISPIDQQQ